ncbi:MULTISPECIES: nucleoside phosphorylase [Streptomyces]|uniref:Uridine phosphorylase n=2 Tax=Streptomyces rimosus subsp. rimosus TaxID=132474 RepID=L8ETL4_STRR1|nr:MULTISPECIES: nucleoside phosphorylase [Streptomyces]KOG67341.1 purine nucleoside phosphorylase [Kitasatospora aureofaciens]MYT43432.1 purine-nucleoside phosphorylase [Streptomyces sp. SID5471]KEF05037.1 purine nucleoside phosphorylase [Streptomyces rimosus]KEF21969.1 purine nucleoside phosphorylase [Streptomyces rimosus]KUJ43117.1 purine nucleoside phosphorylase [Streptomyces rimosus subsp. rimosus]
MTPDLSPIARLPRGGLPPQAVVVGDPARAAAVAELLDGAAEISYHREYRTFTGSWKGVPVVVASHGVGAPGAVLLFQELADAGVRTFVRFGTAGAIRAGVGDGDLVIAEAAVRDDGVTQQLVPPEYPAVAAPEAVLALQRAAAEAGAPYHRGVVWTRAAFQPGLLPLPVAAYTAADVAAIEMEASALFVTASLRGLVAGAVLVIDGANADELVDETATGGYDPHRDVVAEGVARGAVVALEALRALAEEEIR